jgi:FkbM family methyltransferase
VSGRHLDRALDDDRVVALLALLRPGDCFWDIGAHHGYWTLPASRIVGATGHVYSFEPSQYNYRYLKQHLAWNGAANVTPISKGVSGESGWVSFGGGGSSRSFAIGGGSDRIEVTTLAELIASGVRAPDVVKMDVEGSEGAVLATGAARLPSRALLVISVHSEGNYADCVGALHEAGFTLLLSPDLREMRVREQWLHEAELIAIGPKWRGASRGLLDAGYSTLE